MIPADHPALAGHFPGEPIVPGVVLLAEVLRFASGGAASVRGLRLPTVKFHAPLRPGEEFTIDLETDKFFVRSGEKLIVSGRFAFA
jgi:3-hydroxymyristoyl/3-hydroxydecanoyl-(acyl carrier protein) dehydratase